VKRWLVLLVPLAAAAAVAGTGLAGGGGEREPVRLESDAPTFATVDDLAAASDLVVVATIVDVSSGRTLTAGDDPEAGVRTRLYELTVTRTLRGEAPRPLVVEEPAELLDGTPVIVDGMEPLHEGEQAVWYLVSGDGPSQPYYAVVNSQGRVAGKG
jgi:hypothetical protein